MKTLITTLGFLMLPASAKAVTSEIAIEFGTLQNSDVSFNAFSENDTLPTTGLRGAFAINKFLAVQAGWHYTGVGTAYWYEEQSVVAGYQSHFYELGLKTDIALNPYVSPYASLTALISHAEMRFDDDPAEDNSPGFISESAISAGASAAVGIDLHTGKLGKLPPVGWHLDLGYAWLSQADFGQLGTMKSGGIAMRSGISVKF